MSTQPRNRVLVILATALAALAVWTILDPLIGLDLTVRSGTATATTTATVGPVAVALTSLTAGLAGWALLAVLERTVARPARWWRAVALLVYAVSLLGPLGATSTGVALALAALHTVVAGLLVALLPRRSP